MITFTIMLNALKTCCWARALGRPQTRTVQDVFTWVRLIVCKPIPIMPLGLNWLLCLLLRRCKWPVCSLGSSASYAVLAWISAFMWLCTVFGICLSCLDGIGYACCLKKNDEICSLKTLKKVFLFLLYFMRRIFF